MNFWILTPLSPCYLGTIFFGRGGVKTVLCIVAAVH